MQTSSAWVWVWPIECEYDHSSVSMTNWVWVWAGDNDKNGDFTCLSVNVTVQVECDWRESDNHQKMIDRRSVPKINFGLHSFPVSPDPAFSALLPRSQLSWRPSGLFYWRNCQLYIHASRQETYHGDYLVVPHLPLEYGGWMLNTGPLTNPHPIVQAGKTLTLYRGRKDDTFIAFPLCIFDR